MGVVSWLIWVKASRLRDVILVEMGLRQVGLGIVMLVEMGLRQVGLGIVF